MGNRGGARVGAGRPRKPTPLHELDNTRKGKEHADRDFEREFPTSDYTKPRAKEPRKATVKSAVNTEPAVQTYVTLDTLAPPHLDALGAEHWRYYAKVFSNARVMTDADVTLLTMASERWSVYRRAADALKGSLTHETKNNGIIARPENGIASRALNDYYTLMREFGVGPASRSKVKAGADKQADDVESMFT